MNEGLKLNLGCGPGPQPAGWVHLDGSWNGRFAKLPFVRRAAAALGVIPITNATLEWAPGIISADLRRSLPFPADSARCIYSSHVLEHLYEQEARALLDECYRILKPGGVIRLVVPDLRAVIDRYVATSRSDPRTGQAADRFNDELLLRERRRSGGHLAFRLYSAITEFHTHKWMYDEASLIARLIDAGFAQVVRRQFLDSAITGIDEIERADAADEALCVEGVKPTRACREQRVVAR
jgi:SAM-dependent methyltransferase